jgi:hypothetical protein
MVIHSGLVAEQFNRIDWMARAELRDRMPEVEAALRQNKYVAVIKLVEETTDVLAGVTGPIEAKDMPVYKGLVIQTGVSEELAINPGATIGPLSPGARPYARPIPARRDRTITQQLIEVYRPVAAGMQASFEHIRIDGVYESNQTSRVVEIRYLSTKALEINAWNKANNERYAVQDVKWSPTKGEIEATFLRPSNSHITVSKFFVVVPGGLREEYRAGFSGNLTDIGTLYWHSYTTSLVHAVGIPPV